MKDILLDLAIAILLVFAVLCLLAVMQYDDYVASLRWQHRNDCPSGDLVVRKHVVYCSVDGAEKMLGKLQ